MENWLVLIPLLPFAGFLVNGVLRRRLPVGAVGVIACVGPIAAFGIAVAAFFEISGMQGIEAKDARLTQTLWTWMSAGSVEVPFALSLDRLSVLMTLFVTGVGSLIHVYSIGYMKGDDGYGRFFAYLNLFMAAMLVLVTADNIVLMFLGWEGVGLCSYLLIGFWYKDTDNCKAGIKAFVVNRVGDLAFLLGIFGIWVTVGDFDFLDINNWAKSPEGGASEKGAAAAFWIALCLFVGATGKSAQIPLYVWLPDAMAGPTPVSALIHAATMVTSGVYLLARLGPLFSAAPEVMAIVATIGACTAIVAAFYAFSQNDIKKVLAYSTVSQLGYMFLAAGVGAYSIAIFHVVTHAFFKALLFLGAGAVIYSLHHEQDMRKMGGLLKKIPQTFFVFLVGALALSGFPLLAGFWSKDEILHEVHIKAGEAGAATGWTVLWVVGLVTAFFTAFYTFRQIVMVFFGKYRGEEAEAHGAGDDHGHHAVKYDDVRESPLVMRLPLFILAALSIAGGYFAIPHWLDPNPEHVADDHGKLAGLITGGALAIGGIVASVLVFRMLPKLVKAFTTNPLGRLVWNASREKLWVDELYHAVIIRPVAILAEALFYLVDRIVIDFLCVHGSGFYVRAFSNLFRRLQSGRIPTYAVWFLVGALGVLAMTTWFR